VRRGGATGMSWIASGHAGYQHHRVAHLRIAVTVPDEHPDEKGDHRRKVERRVEDVQRLCKERRVEHVVLHPQLTRDVELLLEMEDQRARAIAPSTFRTASVPAYCHNA